LHDIFGAKISGDKVLLRRRKLFPKQQKSKNWSKIRTNRGTGRKKSYGEEGMLFLEEKDRV